MIRKDLEIIINNKCNNNCIFCSNKSLRKDQKEISVEFVKQKLNEEKPSNFNKIYFVGGEPTICKNFFDLIIFAKKKGYEKLAIQTNGRLLSNQKFVDLLKKINVEIGVSLHASKSKIHDNLTQVKGSFNQTLKGIKNLYQKKIDFTTNTVINSKNIDDLHDLMKLFLKIKPKFSLLSLFSPAGLNKKQINELYFDLYKFKKMLPDLITIINKNNLNVNFIDFPICIMEGYEKYMHENNNNNDRKVIIKNFEDSMYFHNKIIDDKTKLFNCKKCSRTKDCNGVWKKYPKNKIKLNPIKI